MRILSTPVQPLMAQSETLGEPSQSFSTFDRALEEYLSGLPKNKKKFKFIELCRDSGNLATPQTINKLLQHEQARQSLSGPMHRIFRRVTSALQDYSEVIGQLVSAQPLPCALIWGALKVVIEASNRCDSMFEDMQSELLSLAEYLQRITVYEDLYGDSTEMQRLFFASYTNIIHFWHRVHKECKHKGFAASARGLNASNLKKLKSAIANIHVDSKNISEQATLCQASKHKQEYSESKAERKLASDFREKQSVANYFELCKHIRDHLSPQDDVIRPNLQCHETNLRYLQPETCRWLTEEDQYIAWCGSTPVASRLLCLSGLPGHGKSMLSSFAICDLESRGAAVAYYFCQFSQQCEDPTEILRLIALQLFNIYFEHQLPLDEEFGHLILLSRKSEHVKDVIEELVVRLLHGHGVYFVIDGLDEAVPNCISPVLELLNNLRKKWSTHEVGLWVTKRRQVRPVECFETYIQPEPKFMLELGDHTEADVVRFLRVKLDALKQRFSLQQDGMSEEEHALFRSAESYLLTRAKGNFLWARLMTENLEGSDRVEDSKELLDYVLRNTPKELADLYVGYLERFRRLDRDNERIAVKVMSIIAYARRQMRLEELQAAASMLAGQGKKKKAAQDASRLISSMPLKTFLTKYTTLIEIDGDASNPSPTSTCRLMHSSVLEYLVENPALLDKDSKDRQLHISHISLANACLMYLCRPVFSELLQKRTLAEEDYAWVDSSGETVDKQVFAQYAAKYWVRHMNDLDNKTEQDQIRERVVTFLSSNNFQTCMQIQSIWIQGRFDEYMVNGRTSILRSIPKWLIRSSSEGSNRLRITKYWLDYRDLMHDWRSLLSCNGCHDMNPDCFYLPLRGELDRVWWATFGEGHLFFNFQSQYKTFRLGDGGNRCSEYFEALCVTAEHIVTVRLLTWDRLHGSLQFVCQHWSLPDHSSAPSLERTQIIATTDFETNWLLYVKPPPDARERLVSRPTDLSSDSQLLRLGSRLFRKDNKNEYLEVSGLPDALIYLEEVSCLGALIAVGSRSHTVVEELQKSYLMFDHLGKDLSRIETLETTSDAGEDNETDEEWLSDGSNPYATDDAGAHESWSEGSTDLDDSSSSSASESEEAELSSSEDDDFSSFGESDPGAADGKSDASSVVSEPPFKRFQDDDSEDEVWGMEVDARLGIQSYGPASASAVEPTLHLRVLQQDAEKSSKVVFEYFTPMRFMLYDSPPIFHPKESLVVWSLGGGYLLFADVTANTYFTRQLRPSAPHTRQISVKLQFSSCGRFLHVASLEVSVREVEKIKGSKRCTDTRCLYHHPLPNINIYLLVLTYRLSGRKPKRSPPALFHRVKVDLGKHEGPLNLSQLPYTFYWTPRDLFVSQRGNYLNIIRVQLFGDETNGIGPSNRTHNVLVPANKTLLPDSAAFRDVHFVPLSEDCNGACLVIPGSETRRKAVLMENFSKFSVNDALESEYADLQKRRTLSPSIGAILQSEHIGGWVKPEGVVIPQDRSMGYLNMRKERFDPVDDCDAEAY